MIKTLKNLLKQDKERYTVPHKVQDVIPVRRIWKDGIFQVGSRFSKTYQFTDINYLVASREDKEQMFLAYSELLNSLDSGATTKITINNRRLNRANFEQSILMPMRGDACDVYRREYNQMLLDKATGANGIWGYALKTAANAFPDVYSNGYLAGPASGQGENPYALLTQTGYREIFYNTAQSLFVLTQDLGDWVTKGLTVSIKGSFDAKNENNLSRTKTSPQWLATGRNEAGELEFNQTKIGEENLTYKQTNKGYRSVYFEAVANWARTFGKHDLSAMFLFQQSQKNYVGESANNSEKALPYRHQGIAGRITYNYDNRYFVEGNFGYNGSENFSPNHRFGFFPSIAVGYVVSNEKFFAPIRDVVSMVKLKASYGLVGNDQIGGHKA